MWVGGDGHGGGGRWRESRTKPAWKRLVRKAKIKRTIPMGTKDKVVHGDWFTISSLPSTCLLSY